LLGRPPSDLHAVISLRDELLALADRSGLPPGSHRLAPAQRLQVLLQSPRFRSFDRSGRYLGQEIPFRLAPLSRLGAVDPGSIPLLTGADCAERLWSVNASILGDDVLRGSESNRTRITIRKRNTFYSQWCMPPGDGREFQVAATRPSRNLLLDPLTDYVAASRPGPAPGTSIEEAAQADAFASARLAPAIGVTRRALEEDDYGEGGSRELAGRGLYGDYSLFLPAEMLSRGGSPGLDLGRVTDILLRVDYVSVARD
jgi:hypothetical protein